MYEAYIHMYTYIKKIILEYYENNALPVCIP